jgi:hypothetical protein
MAEVGGFRDALSKVESAASRLFDIANELKRKHATLFEADTMTLGPDDSARMFALSVMSVSNLVLASRTALQMAEAVRTMWIKFREQGGALPEEDGGPLGVG